MGYMETTGELCGITDRMVFVEEELTRLKELLGPLQKRKATLEKEQKDLNARKFVIVNEITADDVELSSGDGKPFFGEIGVFIAYLRRNNVTKRFAEWNTKIHFTSDLLAGKWSDTGAYIENVPGLK